MINSNKKAYFLYLIISIILIIITAFICIFGIYEPIICISTTSLFGFISLFVNLLDQDSTYLESKPSVLKYQVRFFLKFVSYGIGLLVSFLFLYLLDGNGERIKYLYLLLGLIPWFVSIFVLYLRNVNV